MWNFKKRSRTFSETGRCLLVSSVRLVEGEVKDLQREKQYYEGINLDKYSPLLRMWYCEDTIAIDYLIKCSPLPMFI